MFRLLSIECGLSNKRDSNITARASLVAFAVTAVKGHPGGENLTLCRFENHTLKEPGFSFWIAPITKTSMPKLYSHIFQLYPPCKLQ